MLMLGRFARVVVSGRQVHANDPHAIFTALMQQAVMAWHTCSPTPWKKGPRRQNAPLTAWARQQVGSPCHAARHKKLTVQLPSWQGMVLRLLIPAPL